MKVPTATRRSRLMHSNLPTVVRIRFKLSTKVQPAWCEGLSQVSTELSQLKPAVNALALFFKLS